jgi:RimJ/RimL family protein N-acetyltransferase
MNDRPDYYPFLTGERIYLREVRLEDVNDTYYRWMNDPEVTEFLESRFYPNSIERLQEYVKEQSGDLNNVFLAVCLKENRKHIGNVKLGPINWIHRFAEIGIVIGEKDYWGHGYASEAIGILVRYAFDVLDLHKLTAGCYQAQHGSVKVFQKNGFEIEGVRKKHYFHKGTYVDAVLLGLLNSR